MLQSGTNFFKVCGSGSMDNKVPWREYALAKEVWWIRTRGIVPQKKITKSVVTAENSLDRAPVATSLTARIIQNRNVVRKHQALKRSFRAALEGHQDVVPLLNTSSPVRRTSTLDPAGFTGKNRGVSRVDLLPTQAFPL
jgi:hypothetical protein